MEIGEGATALAGPCFPVGPSSNRAGRVASRSGHPGPRRGGVGPPRGAAFPATIAGPGVRIPAARTVSARRRGPSRPKETDEMQRLPLYFDLRVVVDGGGFPASVGLRGRITCEEEFGSVWMYGVNPGGLAENGKDLESAYANFSRARTEIVGDFARRAADFGAFREDLEEFLMGTTEDIVDEWAAARGRIRDGSVPDLRLARETAGSGADPRPGLDPRRDSAACRHGRRRRFPGVPGRLSDSGDRWFPTERTAGAHPARWLLFAPGWRIFRSRPRCWSRHRRGGPSRCRRSRCTSISGRS